MLRLSPRCLTAIYCIKPAVRARAFHSATADFVNYGVNGELVTRKVSIRIGDPGDSYVMIPPEIGHALQAGTSLINGPTLTNGCARYALNFFHDTQHFAHGKLAPLRRVYELC